MCLLHILHLLKLWARFHTKFSFESKPQFHAVSEAGHSHYSFDIYSFSFIWQIRAIWQPGTLLFSPVMNHTATPSLPHQ